MLDWGNHFAVLPTPDEHVLDTGRRFASLAMHEIGHNLGLFQTQMPAGPGYHIKDPDPTMGLRVFRGSAMKSFMPEMDEEMELLTTGTPPNVRRVSGVWNQTRYDLASRDYALLILGTP